jgi:clan AA aspartic protease (TIGR02281 family)
MTRVYKIGLVLAFNITAAALLISQAGADTLYLKNGRSIEGFVKAQGDNEVEFDVCFGMIKFSRIEIERIEQSSPQDSHEIYKKWEQRKVESKKKEEEIKVKEETAPKKIDVFAEDGQIIVDALINKKINVTLFLDTGASFMVLSNRIAKELGVNTDIDEKSKDGLVQLLLADGRKINAKYVLLKSVTVKGVEALDVDAVVLLEDNGDKKFKDGLLGMSFLKKFSFKVDFKNKQLVLEKLL